MLYRLFIVCIAGSRSDAPRTTRYVKPRSQHVNWVWSGLFWNTCFPMRPFTSHKMNWTEYTVESTLYSVHNHMMLYSLAMQMQFYQVCITRERLLYSVLGRKQSWTNCQAWHHCPFILQVVLPGALHDSSQSHQPAGHKDFILFRPKKTRNWLIVNFNETLQITIHLG